MCLFLYIYSGKSIFRHESCFLSIKKLSLHLVSIDNAEGIFFFFPLPYWGINASLLSSYHFPHRNLHLLHEQKRRKKRAKLKPRFQICMQEVTWFISLGNFIFVHTPSIERLPQTVLQHWREEMGKFIKLFIKLFSQSVKVISMLEKKHKEYVQTEEHVWVSSPTAAEPTSKDPAKDVGTALGCRGICPQTQPWH